MPQLLDDDLFWMESQVETRARLDAEKLGRAYMELAQSVSGPTNARVALEEDIRQADSAIEVCLRYCGVKHAEIPPAKVTDFDTRLGLTCESANVMWRKVKLDSNWYRTAYGAFLGRLDTGEMVALIPSLVRGYRVIEPITGRTRHVTRRLAEHIDQDAYCFYRMFPARKLSPFDLVRFVLGALNAREILFIIFASLCVTLVSLLPAMANQIVFGTVIPSNATDLIAPVGIMLAGVALSKVLITVCRDILMGSISQKAAEATEAATMARVLTLPTGFFKTYDSGNLARRVGVVSMMCNESLSVYLGSVLAFCTSLVFLVQIFSYTPVLLVPTICVAIVNLVAIVSLTYMNSLYDKKVMDADASLSGLVTSLLSGINKIKLSGSEDRAFSKWARGYANYARPSYNRPNVLRLLPAVMACTSILGTAAIYYQAEMAEVTIADFMSFSVAYGQLMGSVTVISTFSAQIARLKPMADLIRPILSAVPEVGEAKNLANINAGGFEMSNISFRYDESLPYVLQNFSLRVRPREYVALVGPSGCGKSTILRLLLGFEKPERGAIYYDGKDASKMDVRSLRRSIGTVMQDSRLILGDIRSNITITNPGATTEEVWTAAELAGIADDILAMPMGLNTMVMEGGGGLSGGQKQRLMIARAICGNRKVLMFDEATSALDNVTQQHVADSLASLSCTRLVIAHRLSTVRHCDRIIVIDQGQVVEEGTYDELMERKGFFADLVERQQLNNEM